MTVFFTVYIVCDFIWIFLEPEAVPSLPRIILFHHVVTFTLLCFPLRYAHLAEFTCWVSTAWHGIYHPMQPFAQLPRFIMG